MRTHKILYCSMYVCGLLLFVRFNYPPCAVIESSKLNGRLYYLMVKREVPIPHVYFLGIKTVYYAE